MYADRLSVGSKRSIRDRLNGDLEDFGHNKPAGGKRQRQSDVKWKHDLYEDNKEPQTSKPKVGPEDLRLKLQKKGSQQAYQGEKKSGVRDLREKLSGTMHTQPSNTDQPKPKSVPESVKLAKKSAPSVEASVPETNKVYNPTSSRKKSQQKSVLSVDGLLQSLGLEKYLITFKAEEIDMTALKHMTDEDLRTLGIPMGPRKKILLELESRTLNSGRAM